MIYAGWLPKVGAGVKSSVKFGCGVADQHTNSSSDQKFAESCVQFLNTYPLPTLKDVPTTLPDAG